MHDTHASLTRFLATARMGLLPWFLLLSFTCTLFVDFNHSAAHDVPRKVYIVYMGNKPELENLTSDLHVDILRNVVGSSSEIVPESLLVHSYTRSFNGFAAKLTEEESQNIAGMDGVVSVFPSENHKLHTTKSWDFIGLPKTVKVNTIQSNIIVGVLDTGIWPESESFSDEGFGPPPKKWKGICQASANFTCNNKIVGARYYRGHGYRPGEVKSPRDTDGHGTHCASIAAGNLVSNADFYGFGSGTARGGVPSARIAVYKVCWRDGCSGADILAAFDDAIADGVDIISISSGFTTPMHYFVDPVAIGSFLAFSKGILTSTSAGNEGPLPGTLTNFAPWLLSVAASTINRKFTAKVQLGNHQIYEGIGLNTFDLKHKFYRLVHAEAAHNNTEEQVERQVQLDPKLVKGKIVFADKIADALRAYKGGAIGVITETKTVGELATSFPFPSSGIGFDHTSHIHYYMDSRNPTATIFKSKEISDTLAPYVPTFSSRGPNIATPNVLKPDLAAPGTYILAAWSPVAPVSGLPGDVRLVKYQIVSGTSMACPHATGVAAYIKSLHPKWSPAAIMSALITTAKPMTADLNPEGEFAYGSGHIDASRAPYPGLVYDADLANHMKFLCAQGYDEGCSGSNHGTSVNDLNYPSFALSTSHPDRSISGVFHRTVTNVGSPNSTYKAKVLGGPVGLHIKVKPKVLSFTSLGQKKSFSLKINGSVGKSKRVSASLVWDDGTFQVRSPIVVYVVM